MVNPKAYWWQKVPNFGDAMAPLLLARFSDLANLPWNPVEDANIVSVGSVLEHIPAGWHGYILGSGLLRETSKLKFNPANAKILALRGPLTAKAFPPGNYAMGDPGLLAGELIEPQEKQWDLGIVPHWQDDELAERFTKLIPEQFTTKVILPGGDPISVLKEIGACKRLVTSSLHGMIAADSMGIPRRVEACAKMNADGGLFKFMDYSAAIQCPFEVGKIITPERNRVDDARFEIFDAYRELSRTYEAC